MSVDSGNQRTQSSTPGTNNSTTASNVAFNDSNSPAVVDPFSISCLGKMDRNKITLLNIFYTDGKAEVPSATGVGIAPNRPPAEMIIKPTEDVEDLTAYYRPCPPNGKRDLGWRVELGTQLVAQMDPAKSGGGLFCLKNWPEGYALFDRYAHVKVGVSFPPFLSVANWVITLHTDSAEYRINPQY